MLSAYPALGCGRGSRAIFLPGGRYACRPVGRPAPAPYLYAYQTAGNRWLGVPYNRLVPSNLYVRWSGRSWVWITSQDFRPIAAGSKLQWRRIETTGQPLDLDWFRLGDNGFTWTRVTDRDRPAVYRWDAYGRKVLSEQYPENWQSFGGAVDAPPSDAPPSEAPKCVITATPRSATIHQPLVLRIELQGTVSDVLVENQHLPIHLEKSPAFAEVTSVPEAAGFFTASATVKGPGGSFTCQAPYDVKLAAAEFSREMR